MDLNFPLRLLFDLPPAAMSPKAIQRVATVAALGQHLLTCCGTSDLRSE